MRFQATLAFAALSLTFPSLQSAQATPTTLVDFALEDHARALHSPREWSGRRLVLFLADRRGSEFNKGYAWTSPLVGHVKTQASGDTALASVADLRGTARLGRGFVRSLFAPASGDPVGLTLLDWKGDLFRAYGLEPSAFHMLVFDEGHRLVYRAALRVFDASRLADVRAALNELPGMR